MDSGFGVEVREIRAFGVEAVRPALPASSCLK